MSRSLSCFLTTLKDVWDPRSLNLMWLRLLSPRTKSTSLTLVTLLLLPLPLLPNNNKPTFLSSCDGQQEILINTKESSPICVFLLPPCSSFSSFFLPSVQHQYYKQCIESKRRSTSKLRRTSRKRFLSKFCSTGAHSSPRTPCCAHRSYRHQLLLAQSLVQEPPHKSRARHAISLLLQHDLLK